jgi:transmembrane protein TMEM174 (potassium channel)
MFRGSHPHGEIDPDGFRLRGFNHVYRIESFSDAVFAFVVTLLVVSLEVPKSFDDLTRSLSGFLGFAFSFAVLVQIWVVQNRFFRRYGLHDGKTIFLTSTLLFLVILFTYPLKFLSRLLVFVSSGDISSVIRLDQLWELFLLYGLGYAAVFFVFGSLYRHALTKADVLALTPKERILTRDSAGISFGQMLAPAASIAIAVSLHLTGNDGIVGPAAGFIYPFVITAVITAIKFRSARKLRKLDETA